MLLIRVGAAAATAVAVAVACATPAAAAGDRVASGLGLAQVDGRPAVVSVVVAVPEGAEEEAATRQALAVAGAEPVAASTQDDGFAPFGFTWPQFSDPARLPPRNDRPVVQYYNPVDDPTGGDSLSALRSTHATWSGVDGSAFRMDLGGTTSRCPSLACQYGRFLSPGFSDGFNDVGWVAMPFEPQVLGIAVVALDPSLETILEADVALNAESPLFVPDPHHPEPVEPADLETVLLHENGHVAGLAHVDDPAAVMYPIIAGVRRDLGPGEEAGIAFLYPLDPPREHPGHPLHPERPPHPPPPTVVLATLGDPAPGGGSIYRDFELGDLDDSGRGAYAADLRVAGEHLGEGVFTANRHGVHEIVRSGAPAPGGGTLGAGIFGRAAQDERGNAAFAFVLDPFEFPFGVNTGVYRAPATGGQVEPIMVPNVTRAPGGELLVGAREAIVGAGVVVFDGLTADGAGGLRAGLYRHEAGVISQVAVPGQPMPGGGNLVEPSDPSMNERGDVAFAANLDSNPCFDFPEFYVGCDFPANAFVRRASGTLETVVRYGMPAPGIDGGVFEVAIDPRINAAGDVLFEGRGTKNPEGVSFGGVLYVHRGGRLEPIVRSLDPLPGGGRLFEPAAHSLNDRGDVAFIGINEVDFNGDGRRDEGIYLHRDGALRLIARTGTALPRIGTVARFLRTGIAGAELDDRGRLMFPARLTDGRTVLLLADL